MSLFSPYTSSGPDRAGISSPLKRELPGSVTTGVEGVSARPRSATSYYYPHQIVNHREPIRNLYGPDEDSERSRAREMSMRAVRENMG